MTTTAIHTLDTFIAAHGITSKASRLSKERAGWDRDARHFRVTLKAGELGVNYREMSVTFSQGSAWTTDPTTADVLDCLASDAAGFQGQGFESWCAEYGYDTDSRRSYATYLTVKRQSDRLYAFLGGDHYHHLLNNAERQ